MSLSEIILVCLSVTSAVGVVVVVIKCVSVIRENNAKTKRLYASLALQERQAEQQDEEVSHLLVRASAFSADICAKLSETASLKENPTDEQTQSSHVVINLATAAKPPAQTNDQQAVAVQEQLRNLPRASPKDAGYISGEQQQIRQKADETLEEQLTVLNHGVTLLKR